MTRTGFVIANLGRRKTRTVLTLLSIVMAFLLFGLLQAVNVLFSAGADFVGATRLVTQARVSFTTSLPMRLLPQIESVPGVERVMWSQWFGGVWQENTQLIIQAADPARLHDVYPELVMPDDQWKAFAETRTGMIAGRILADQHGWKIGQKIPIGSNIFPQKDGSKAWAFDLVGIYDGKDEEWQRGTNGGWINFAYFDEANQFGSRPRRRVHHQARGPGPRSRGFSDDRRHVRELPRRDQDPDREGLQPRLLQADRRHRPDRALDPVRGVLHAAARRRQYDRAERARAHTRTGHPEDARLQRRQRPRLRDRRGGRSSASSEGFSALRLRRRSASQSPMRPAAIFLWPSTCRSGSRARSPSSC